MADENAEIPPGEKQSDEVNDDELAALFAEAENAEKPSVEAVPPSVEAVPSAEAVPPKAASVEVLSDEISEDELAALQMTSDPSPRPMPAPAAAPAHTPAPASAPAKTATATQVKHTTPAFAPVAPFPDVAPTENGMGLLMDIPLRVSIELGRISMTLQQVLALGRGSIIELERLAGEPVDILVNDKLIGYGEVVVVDEYFGVKITELIDPKG